MWLKLVENYIILTDLRSILPQNRYPKIFLTPPKVSNFLH